MNELAHLLGTAGEIGLALWATLRALTKFFEDHNETLHAIDNRLKTLEQKDALYWRWFARAHGVDPTDPPQP